MLRCIDILKAVACLLILNFHSDILFPDKLSLLAFGGDVGNNIFFLVSGFVLYDSINRLEWSDIGEWLKKRYFRILPLVIVTELMYIFVLGSKIISIKMAVEMFVFPTIYWFTGAIVIFYPLLFCVEKIKNNVIRIVILIGLIIGHLILDSLFAERYFIGFLAMMMGCTVKRIINNHEDIVKKISIWLYFSLLVGFGMIYVVLKLLRNRGYEIGGLIHLGIGLSTILIAVFLLLFLYVHEEELKKIIDNRWPMKWIISTLSSITLSVYLVQGFADRILVKAFLQVPFPVSYILDLMAVLCIAYAVTDIDNYFHKITKGKC